MNHLQVIFWGIMPGLCAFAQKDVYDLPEWVFHADGSAGVAHSELSVMLDPSTFGLNVEPSLGGRLESLPSVSMLRRGHNSFEPNIRGFTGGQIVTLFNGLLLPEGSPTRTGSAINLFSGNFGGTVKVEMAVASVVGGLSNIGGRISIDSYPILPEGMVPAASQMVLHGAHSDVDSGYTTGLKYNTYDANSAYSVGFEYRENGDYRAGDGRYVDADYAACSGDFSAAWRLTSSQKLFAALHWIEQDLVRNSSLPMDLRDATALLTTLKHEYSRDQSIWSVNAGYGTYDHPLDTQDRMVPPILQGIHSEMDTETINFGFDYLRYFDSWQMKVGVDHQRLFREARRVVTTAGGAQRVDALWPNIASESIGAYWQGILRSESDSEWRIGLRLDQKRSEAEDADALVPLPVAQGATVLENYRAYNDNASGEPLRDELAGRLNLIYSRKLDENWVSTTGLTYSVTDPVLSKRYRSFVAALGGDGEGGSAFEIGNPWLHNEKKLEWSSQLVFENERLTFHADAYVAFVWDYAARQRIATVPVAVFGFRGEDIRIVGGDVKLNYKLESLDIGQFMIPFAVSWAQGSSRETGFDLAEIAPLEISGGIHWESGQDVPVFQASFNAYWTAGKDNPRPMDVPIYLNTDAYIRFDLSMHWQFSQAGRLVLGIENLFDELAYHYLQPPVATGPAPSSGDLVAGDAIPVAGRDLFFSILFEF